MSDKTDPTPSFDNIKGLVQDVSAKLQRRMDELRVGTAFEDVRPSDARTFALIGRRPRNLSELAQDLGISRQATHRSVMRLVERGGVSLQSVEGNNRDKIAVPTELGKKGQQMAAKNLQILESELEEKLGPDDLTNFRRILVKILAEE